MKHPWLVAGPGGALRPPRKPDESSDSEDDEEDSDSDDDEEIVIDGETLSERRERWALEVAHVEMKHFKTAILGGGWLEETHHLHFDTIEGHAIKDAVKWCRNYHVQMSFGSKIRTYSDRLTGLLALEWCRRMQYYYNMFVDAADPAYVYTPEDHMCLPASEEFDAAIAALPADHPARERRDELFALRPA